MSLFRRRRPAPLDLGPLVPATVRITFGGTSTDLDPTAAAIPPGQYAIGSAVIELDGAGRLQLSGLIVAMMPQALVRR